MNIRARHMLKGRVTHVTPRAVHTEVMIALPDSTDLVSMIPIDDPEAFGRTLAGLSGERRVRDDHIARCDSRDG